MFNINFVKSENSVNSNNDEIVKQEFIGNNGDFIGNNVIVSVKPSDFFNENDETAEEYFDSSSNQFLENSSNQDPLDSEGQKDSFKGFFAIKHEYKHHKV